MASGMQAEAAVTLPRGPWLAALAAAGLPLAIALLVIQPLILVASALALMGLWAALRWPNSYTLLVIGLIYANVATVAVRFHGLPLALGMAIPLLLAIPIGWRWRAGHPPVVDRTGLLLVLFFLTQLFSMLFSADRSVSLRVVVGTASEGLILYLLVFNAVHSTALLRQVTWVLLLAGAAMGSLCLVQYATKSYDNDYGGFAQIEERQGFQTAEADLQGVVRQRRLAGPLGEQNRFAQIMLMLVPLGMTRFWAEKNSWLKIAALASTAVIGLGLMLAFSRGAAVGFAILVAAMLLMGYITPRQGLAVAMGTGLLVLVLPQFATRLASLGSSLQAVRSHAGGIAAAEGSLRSRTGEALSALLMFADHPLTGVGPGMYRYHYQHYAAIVGTDLQGVKVQEEMRQPHILYLGLAAELGAPGLLAFLLLVGVVLFELARLRRASLVTGREDLAWLTAGYLLAVIAYLATGLFLHLSYGRYLWLMIALASAAIAAATRALSAAQPIGSAGASPSHSA